jgi:hypothetical protein
MIYHPWTEKSSELSAIELEVDTRGTSGGFGSIGGTGPNNALLLLVGQAKRRGRGGRD